MSSAAFEATTVFSKAKIGGESNDHYNDFSGAVGTLSQMFLLEQSAAVGAFWLHLCENPRSFSEAFDREFIAIQIFKRITFVALRIWLIVLAHFYGALVTAGALNRIPCSSGH